MARQKTRLSKKGCGCKKSGCLKNYCECYELNIACTTYCRCLGCKNSRSLHQPKNVQKHPATSSQGYKKGGNPLKKEAIEAIVGCLVAKAQHAEIYELSPADFQFELIMQFNRSLGIILQSF